MTRRLLFIVSFLCTVPFSAFAQGVPQGTMLQITSNPKFPEPSTPVTLTLEAYGTVIIDDTIEWYVNGNLAKKGIRTLSLTSPTISSSTHVAVKINQGTETYAVEKSLTSSLLSIILESSAPTPIFTNEKMNIPAGTPFIAIATLTRGGEPSPYIYTWELGESNSGTVTGSRVSLIMPEYETLLFLTVTDKRGAVVHQGGVTLVPAEPLLSIYPLTDGVASHFPLTDTYIPLKDTESFFAAVRHGTQKAPQWTLNDTPLTNLDNPYLLILSQLLTARATLSLSLAYGPFDVLLAKKAVTITQ